MRTSPAASQRTPKKTRPGQTTPPSKPAGAQALHGNSLADSSRRRRRDVDGDDENAEYIPRPRSKRHKATSNASDDAHIVLEPQRPEPELDASPIWTCPPAADGQCPVCFTLLAHIADGSVAAKESHVDACIKLQLSSSPSPPAPVARLSNTVLPNRSRDKHSVPAAHVAVNINNQFSIPESPLVDAGHEDLIDNAQEYLRRSSAEPLDLLPHPLPGHAERSLPSPASNAARPETTTPEPSPAIENPTEQQTLAHEPQAQPRPEIHYYIIASRTPRLSKIHWAEGSLADRTIGAIFDEVAAVASKSDVQRIAFKLTTSRSDIQYTISRNNEKIYEIMKKVFSKDVNADLGRGNMEFDIELELDPGNSAVPVQTEESGLDFGFSF